MKDQKVAALYYSSLKEISVYPQMPRCAVGFGHSIEWESEDDGEMIGAYIDFPQIIEDTGILRCKLSMFKTAVCLMVVLINRVETDTLLKTGTKQFSEYLFPSDGNLRFLSKKAYRQFLNDALNIKHIVF